MKLIELLRKYKHDISSYAYFGFSNWDNMIDKIENYSLHEIYPIDIDSRDEQILTFLLVCGYSIIGEAGVEKITDILTSNKNNSFHYNKLWFKPIPISPRLNEGRFHIDLALGNISLRNDIQRLIELDIAENSWVCFCDMKWYSDISYGIANDIHRNQLARAIEAALSFQRNGTYVDKIFITLVTPEIFINPTNKSRLYQYKFQEYMENSNHIIDDIKRSCLAKNDKDYKWFYPEMIEERTEKLSLHWMSYEYLFNEIPESPISMELKCFFEECFSC
ncbi:MAG: hypothetical protein KA369_05775 [Spirochaetes bacterium]|nr:hypothetical protein [Spirochaetota bacterium]